MVGLGVLGSVAAAHVGIALGSGTDIAIKAAPCVLMRRCAAASGCPGAPGDEEPGVASPGRIHDERVQLRRPLARCACAAGREHGCPCRQVADAASAAAAGSSAAAVPVAASGVCRSAPAVWHLGGADGHAGQAQDAHAQVLQTRTASHDQLSQQALERGADSAQGRRLRRHARMIMQAPAAAGPAPLGSPQTQRLKAWAQKTRKSLHPISCAQHAGLIAAGARPPAGARRMQGADSGGAGLGAWGLQLAAARRGRRTCSSRST